MGSPFHQCNGSWTLFAQMLLGFNASTVPYSVCPFYDNGRGYRGRIQPVVVVIFSCVSTNWSKSNIYGLTEYKGYIELLTNRQQVFCIIADLNKQGDKFKINP